jgi:hypothetical protein
MPDEGRRGKELGAGIRTGRPGTAMKGTALGAFHTIGPLGPSGVTSG